MNATESNIPAVPPKDDEIEIDLIHVLARIQQGFVGIACCALAGLVIGLILALTAHKTYTAEAVFLPPTSEDPVSATSFNLRQDPSDLYLGLLSSRTLADSVIDQAHLMEAYHTNFRWQARRILAGQSSFGVSKNALISVSVTTRDPKLSADIGNAYLEALYKLSGEMTTSASRYRQKFFEEQLEIEKSQLADAEVALKQTEEKSGIVLPEGEAQADLSATARLQADIDSAESRLSALLQSSTESNPSVVELRAQINSMRSHLREQQLNAGAGPGHGLTPTSALPGVMLEYARKSREFHERETLYESLTQQYEKARLAALDPGPQLEVVDLAVPPEQKSGPPRTKIVVVSTLAGLLLGILVTVFGAPVRQILQRYRRALAALSAR